VATSLDLTRVVLADERAAITAWASRHAWVIALDLDGLICTAKTTHPNGQTVIFRADLSGYPVQPPAWWCGESRDDRSTFPGPPTAPPAGLPSSIFHPNAVICAPWNRLAYSIHGGPHNDWRELRDWKQAAPGSTRAHTVTDMLDALRLHLQYSPGMLA
jgi:hypothetical protein